MAAAMNSMAASGEIASSAGPGRTLCTAATTSTRSEEERHRISSSEGTGETSSEGKVDLTPSTDGTHSRDILRGGPGDDTCYAEENDVSISCETLK